MALYVDSKAGVQVDVTEASYPVVGSTARQLRTVMQALGPARGGRSFGAYTDWEVTWRYDYESAPEQWRVGLLRVDVRVTVTTPRWRPPRSAPSSLVEGWRRYLLAVDRHEQGHVDFAAEAGRAVRARIAALPALASREELDRIAASEAEAALSEARERERAYDEATQHGFADGVRLPEEP